MKNRYLNQITTLSDLRDLATECSDIDFFNTLMQLDFNAPLANESINGASLGWRIMSDDVVFAKLSNSENLMFIMSLIDFNLTPTKSERHDGVSVGSISCHSEPGRRALRKFGNLNFFAFSKINLEAAPKSEPYKGVTIRRFLSMSQEGLSLLNKKPLKEDKAASYFVNQLFSNPKFVDGIQESNDSRKQTCPVLT